MRPDTGGTTVIPDEVLIFRSREHPGSAPRAAVFARSLVRPLAVCLLPLAIAVLVLTLQGLFVLSLLVVGFPLCALSAFLWTAYRLRRTVAEIRLADGVADVRSVWECADPSDSAAGWSPVLDVRDYRSWMLLTVGLQPVEIERGDWPDYDFLASAVRDTHQYQRRFG